MDQEKNNFTNNNSTTIGGVTFGGGSPSPASAGAFQSTPEPANNSSNIFTTSSKDPFAASSNSPFGENGFSQAASAGTPNSNNHLAQQAIANAANLTAQQAKNPSAPQNDLNTPQSTLNVPVVSPTHFDFQTSVNPTLPSLRVNCLNPLIQKPILKLSP